MEKGKSGKYTIKTMEVSRNTQNIPPFSLLLPYNYSPFCPSSLLYRQTITPNLTKKRTINITREDQRANYKRNLGFSNCTLLIIAGGGAAASGMTWRTKRKEAAVDDVSDEFSDFSLSSPARKIRRLDLDLPPIMESVEEEVPMVHSERPCGVVIEELSPASLEENPERAIVVLNSVGASSNPLLYTPWGSESGFSVSMSSDLLSGLKSKYKKLWTDHEEEDRIGERAAKECMAIVPWVPSRFPSSTDATNTDNTELMEDENMGEAEMDIEEGSGESLEQMQGFPFGNVPQWQQQHCVAPHMTPSNATPLTLFPVASNNM